MVDKDALMNEMVEDFYQILITYEVHDKQKTQAKIKLLLTDMFTKQKDWSK